MPSTAVRRLQMQSEGPRILNNFGEIMTNIFDQPFAALQAAAPAQGPGIPVRGIEVVQAVQSLDGAVKLIAGKATFARFYFDAGARARR